MRTDVVLRDKSALFVFIKSLITNPYKRGFFFSFYDYSNEEKMKTGEINPKILKEKLGLILVTQLHNEDLAKKAQEHFNHVFSQRQIPTDMPEIIVDTKCHTSEPGIFAAGDVTTVPYKQIVISMGEGAKASLAAFEYLLSHEVVESEQESEAA